MSKDDIEFNWQELYPSSITVCDIHGVIVAMNSVSRKIFSSRGGEALIVKAATRGPGRLRIVKLDAFQSRLAQALPYLQAVPSVLRAC